MVYTLMPLPVTRRFPSRITMTSTLGVQEIPELGEDVSASNAVTILLTFS